MAIAQGVTPESLAAAQRTAQQTEKDWFTLAQGLDAKLAPMLPCDPAARRAVQAVSQASEARVSALAAYLRLESAQAADRTQGARRLLEAEESNAPEAADERTDAALERSAIEEQSATLKASAGKRSALNDAGNELAQINSIAAKRSTFAEQTESGRDRGVAALRDLAAVHQAREAALRDEIAAFQTESTRWNTYYSVLLSRAQAECTAIGGGGAAPARPASKGKKQ